MTGESELWVYFPRQPSYLSWRAAQGLVERFGPQMVPLDGRGEERLDLRLHGLAPLDRAFWPFPARPVPVDESQRPPGPGEEPAPHTEVGPVSLAQLQRHIAALGSPPVSTLVGLPLRRDGKAASFGLDLGPHVERVAGKERPGAYLVGLRRLDSSSERSWMRVQVTDLSLTTLEEPDAVRFAVTSLARGLPVAGASIRVEGTRENKWVTLAEGTTGADGSFRWPAPGWDPAHPIYRQVRRIVVASDGDALVLDPLHAPDSYADNHWSATRETWLQWAFEPLAARTPPPEDLCHIFTERPVYRPDETVHVKGYLRRRERGTLSPLSFAGTVVIQGPGEQSWKRPVTLTPGGSFYTAFSETNLPTGDYSAHLEDAKKKPYGNVTFRIDAYRIPTFEVELHAPDKVPLDGEFQVALTSTYYAGGKVAPEVIVVGPDGSLQKGTEVKVRLLNRQWHSHLRASDFSNGVARYVTDVVDEKVSETTVTSGEEPTTLHLPLDHAGVYVVELEAHDRLGRAQVIGVDLYAGGAEPVTWAKPATRVFEVATDKEADDPGETAALVLKSPFQQGRALAVTEGPEGNAYQWIEVKGGSATLKVPVQGTYAPKLPVHFILMRGRVPGAAATPKGQTDLGKPSTVAATAWVKVNPVDNRVDVTLENPPKARPGDTIPVTIRLRDPRKKPIAGEVTLWLVDQAVLALGKEQRLDPIPDFLVDPRSRLTVRDTRGLVFGHLPFAEQPGGSGGEGEQAGLFEKVTVRRSFKPVPYYNPAIEVGPDGVATVQVALPTT